MIPNSPWQYVKFWESVAIGILGGTIGVIFTNPLRRALVSDESSSLPFPEGTIIARVLKATATIPTSNDPTITPRHIMEQQQTQQEQLEQQKEEEEDASTLVEQAVVTVANDDEIEVELMDNNAQQQQELHQMQQINTSITRHNQHVTLNTPMEDDMIVTNSILPPTPLPSDEQAQQQLQATSSENVIDNETSSTPTPAAEHSMGQVSNIRLLVAISLGVLFGSFMKLGDVGFKLWQGDLSLAWFLFPTAGKLASGWLFYIGCSFSPSLFVAGVIVKLKPAMVICMGGLIAWWLCVPVFHLITNNNSEVQVEKSALEIANTLFFTKLRMIGVGAMMLGGLLTFMSMLPSLVKSMKIGIESSVKRLVAMRNSATATATTNATARVGRTERDIPLLILIICIVAITVPLTVMFIVFAEYNVLLALCMSLFTIVAGFMFSAVGAFLAYVHFFIITSCFFHFSILIVI